MDGGGTTHHFRNSQRPNYIFGRDFCAYSNHFGHESACAWGEWDGPATPQVQVISPAQINSPAQDVSPAQFVLAQAATVSQSASQSVIGNEEFILSKTSESPGDYD